MHSLKTNKLRGFTIVELLIVIVVIGILATLVIVTFTGMQRRARDTARQADISAIASHLAVFHADNGFYPTRDNMNDASWRAENLQGLPADAVIDPRGDDSATAPLAATATESAYGYAVTPTGCDNDPDDGGLCENFTLTAVLEDDDENFVRSSN